MSIILQLVIGVEITDIPRQGQIFPGRSYFNFIPGKCEVSENDSVLDCYSVVINCPKPYFGIFPEGLSTASGKSTPHQTVSYLDLQKKRRASEAVPITNPRMRPRTTATIKPAKNYMGKSRNNITLLISPYMIHAQSYCACKRARTPGPR